MLLEPRTTRREDGGLRRRWFTDEHMDLYLWFDDDGDLVRMQLCYHDLAAEKVLWWSLGEGYRHDAIDDGAGVAGRARSPILVADGTCDVEALLVRFRAASFNLGGATFDLVYRHLLEYKHQSCDRFSGRGTRAPGVPTWP